MTVLSTSDNVLVQRFGDPVTRDVVASIARAFDLDPLVLYRDRIEGE